MIHRTRAVVGIQARMSSGRLPGKVIADVSGKPLIQRVWERARSAELVDEAYVLTSFAASDDPLVAELERCAIPYRRGFLSDVLSRYVALADELDPRFLVRVTGDCPLVEPGFIDQQIRALEAFDGDLIEVEGGGVEGVLGGQSTISSRALRLVLESEDPRDREHVGAFYFVNCVERFRFVGITVPDELRDRGIRLSVDEEEDLALVRRVYDHFTGADGKSPSVAEVLSWLDANPEVRDLNRSVVESRDNQDLRAMKRESKTLLVGRYAP
ncbi:MAG: hypothetical protein O7B99_05835 [Planctomycetota bacterium]|nr:hypothetical protein [Planctomycetota bacterium]